MLGPHGLGMQELVRGRTRRGRLACDVLGPDGLETLELVHGAGELAREVRFVPDDQLDGGSRRQDRAGTRGGPLCFPVEAGVEPAGHAGEDVASHVRADG